MNIYSQTLVIIGLIFIALSTIGLHRFDTIYKKIHASTLSTTLGTIFIVASIIIYSIISYETSLEKIIGSTFILHSLIGLIAIIMTNCVSAHAIAKSAHKSGYDVKGNIDMLEVESSDE